MSRDTGALMRPPSCQDLPPPITLAAPIRGRFGRVRRSDRQGSVAARADSGPKAHDRVTVDAGQPRTMARAILDTGS